MFRFLSNVFHNCLLNFTILPTIGRLKIYLRPLKIVCFAVIKCQFAFFFEKSAHPSLNHSCGSVVGSRCRATFRYFIICLSLVTIP